MSGRRLRVVVCCIHAATLHEEVTLGLLDNLLIVWSIPYEAVTLCNWHAVSWIEPLQCVAPAVSAPACSSYERWTPYRTPMSGTCWKIRHLHTLAMDQSSQYILSDAWAYTQLFVAPQTLK